jgi:hypothetical protein
VQSGNALRRSVQGPEPRRRHLPHGKDGVGAVTRNTPAVTTPCGPPAWPVPWPVPLPAGGVWSGGDATAIRTALGWSVADFAVCAGVSLRTVAYWAARPARVPRGAAVQGELTVLAETAALMAGAIPLEPPADRPLRRLPGGGGIDPEWDGYMAWRRARAAARAATASRWARYLPRTRTFPGGARANGETVRVPGLRAGERLRRESPWRKWPGSRARTIGELISPRLPAAGS